MPQIQVSSAGPRWAAASNCHGRGIAPSARSVRVGADQLGHVADRRSLGLDPSALGRPGRRVPLSPPISAAQQANLSRPFRKCTPCAPRRSRVWAKGYHEFDGGTYKAKEISSEPPNRTAINAKRNSQFRVACLNRVIRPRVLSSLSLKPMSNSSCSVKYAL